jgi:AcrR family transcriptional regulator
MATRRRISRHEILEGAANILDSGVFGDLTVDSLARALHMSKSTLYKHFASKEDLIVALVDGVCRVTETELDQADFSGDTIVALSTLANLYGAHASRLPRAVILQHRRLPAPCQDRLELTSATVGRACRDIVNRGTSGGSFSGVSAEFASTCFLASSRAAMEASARGEIEQERDASVVAVYNLLLPGLTGQGAVA